MKSEQIMFDLIVGGASMGEGSVPPPLAGDIAVHGERVAAVGKIPEAQGRRVIRAQGLIACPGFVDVHTHSDDFLLHNPRAESAVRQGVTTEIGGNCGYSAAPIWGAWGEDRAETYREVYGLDTRWHGVQEYFALVAAEGPSINFGLLPGHNTIRGSVMGGAARPPDGVAMAAMLQ